MDTVGMAADWYLHVLSTENDLLEDFEAMKVFSESGAPFEPVSEKLMILNRKMIATTDIMHHAFWMGAKNQSVRGSRAANLNELLTNQPLTFELDDLFRRAVLRTLNTPIADHHWRRQKRQALRTRGDIVARMPHVNTNAGYAFCHPRDFNRFMKRHQGETATLMAW
jgi:hypothetical protein